MEMVLIFRSSFLLREISERRTIEDVGKPEKGVNSNSNPSGWNRVYLSSRQSQIIWPLMHVRNDELVLFSGTADLISFSSCFFAIGLSCQKQLGTIPKRQRGCFRQVFAPFGYFTIFVPSQRADNSLSTQLTKDSRASSFEHHKGDWMKTGAKIGIASLTPLRLV